MKKALQITLALVCILTMTVSLCGCDGLDSLPFMRDSQTAQGGTVHVVAEATHVYQQPNQNSQIVATYPAGTTVTYTSELTLNGITWAQTDKGWFILSHSDTEDTPQQSTAPAEMPTEVPTEEPTEAPTEAPTELITESVQEKGIITDATSLYARPSSSAEVTGQLEPGTRVSVSQIATVDGIFWGFVESGWIQLENYFRVDHLTTPVSYGVIRDNDACFYPAPSVYSGVVGTPSCGSRHPLLAVIEVNGMSWCYTSTGWITTDMMYVEGTVGFRACSAIVIDPTPLNVRIAPGTSNEVLTTLTYGDRVNILEQVNYNGSDWGFTGTGWIFMDLTEIQ